MIAFDPSSFRDPAGRLFRHNGFVYRTCSDEGLKALQRAVESGLIDRLVGDGLLVPTTIVDSRKEGLPPEEVGLTVARQPELPLVTYAYEWSFSMLRDAARVTLQALD